MAVRLSSSGLPRMGRNFTEASAKRALISSGNIVTCCSSGMGQVGKFGYVLAGGRG